MSPVRPVLALWFAALCFPLAAKTSSSLLGFPTFPRFPVELENRLKNLFPRWRETPLRQFGARVDNWYADNWAWRTPVLTFFRGVRFHWLKSPVGREVPGAGRWIFRRGGDWAELDDYLGAFELSPERLRDWLDLFEGRREWARAHGAEYFTLVAAVKAQTRSEKILPVVRDHRGRNLSLQLREALADCPARDDVLFLDEAFAASLAEGREVFYEADHHPNARGEWVLYDRLNAALRERFPGRIGEMPWFDPDAVPDAVREGRAFGCWPVPDPPSADRAAGAEPPVLRLAVSAPGERQTDAGLLRQSRRYPYSNVAVERDGPGLSLLLGHDSYLRFSLASWRGRRGDVRFPFAPGVSSVRAYIFQRFTTGFLEEAFSDGVPDAVIEQFPEPRLGDGPVGLDATMRAAARFSRGVPMSDPAGVPSSRKAGVRAVFERVEADPAAAAAPGARSGAKPRLTAVLSRGGKVCCRATLPPGPRRAVFFPPVVPEAFPPGPFEVALEGGTAASVAVEIRDLVGR